MVTGNNLFNDKRLKLCMYLCYQGNNVKKCLRNILYSEDTYSGSAFKPIPPPKKKKLGPMDSSS